MESLNKKEEELKMQNEEVDKDGIDNQFASGSEFKSVSLINMDPYKYERSKTLSTFEDYLSKSTYFQSKVKQLNQFNLPKKLEFSTTRPLTCKDLQSNNKVTQSLGLINNSLSRKLINKFIRVELVYGNKTLAIDSSPKLEFTEADLNITNENTNAT